MVKASAPSAQTCWCESEVLSVLTEANGTIAALVKAFVCAGYYAKHWEVSSKDNRPASHPVELIIELESWHLMACKSKSRDTQHRRQDHKGRPSRS